MTGKQIKEAQDKLPHGMGCWRKMTDEQKREYAELACRNMINSILVYGGRPIKEDGSLDQYLSRYYKKGESEMHYVGEERVRKLVAEQQEDFKKATVNVGVYTDHDGCTYNSVSWGD